ncbi:MAG: aromatic amino acid transport family protein [Patescibacteria group bacterium]
MLRLISPFWEAVGLISGMIIGSGMFAIPYAVTMSGFWRGVFGAIVAFFAVLAIHLAYGEVVTNDSEAHRLPGFVRKHFGSFAGEISGFSQILSFNIVLIVYGILGGKFLSTFIGYGSSEFWAILFFILCGLIFLLISIRSLGFISLMLTTPLIAATLYISYLAIRVGNLENIIFINGTNSFFAFSVFVFALSGLSVIADAKNIWKGSVSIFSQLRKAIIVSTTIPAILYVVFTAGVLSASGIATTPDSLTGLIPYLGNFVVRIGSLIGFLAVITSYLGLGYDLRKIYELDRGIHSFVAWGLVAIVPLGFFIAGLTSFIKLMSLVGGFFVVVDGIFVIFVLRKMRNKPGHIKFLPFNSIIQFALVILFVASATLEVLYQIRY